MTATTCRTCGAPVQQPYRYCLSCSDKAHPAQPYALGSDPRLLLVDEDRCPRHGKAVNVGGGAPLFDGEGGRLVLCPVAGCYWSSWVSNGVAS